MMKKLIPVIATAFGVLAFLTYDAVAKARYVPPDERREKYSISEGEAVVIPAKKATFPLVVYGDTPGLTGGYVPSGYMGDASAIKMKSSQEAAPLPQGTTTAHSLKIEYGRKQGWRMAAPGRQGWVGIYWLKPANNWAKIKGAGYDLTGATKLSFWARGEKGGELIGGVQVGGVVGAYPDTDQASIGPIRLSDQWEKYSIDLAGKDMRHIVGGFAFTMRRADNPRGAVFFLDEIMFEGEAPEAAAQ